MMILSGLYPNLTFLNSTSPFAFSNFSVTCSSSNSSSFKNSNTLSPAAAALCKVLKLCAMSDNGLVNSLTYIMNATITPNDILPLIANAPPTMQTITYEKFPANCITGIISPDRNCDFQALV